MICNNKVSYHVPKGYGYKEIFVRCGNTNHKGSRATCDRCASDKFTMESINRQEENIAADNAWSHSAGWGDW